MAFSTGCYLTAVMGHNLGLVMRKLFGTGKPREFAAVAAGLAACLERLEAVMKLSKCSQTVIICLQPHLMPIGCIAVHIRNPRRKSALALLLPV